LSAAWRIAALAAIGLPATVALAWARSAWSIVGASVAASLVVAYVVDAARERRLRTAAAVLAAYREGDFSIRARNVQHGGALGDVVAELNELGDVLRGHRLGAMEAWTLLRKVMSEVDVVVVAVAEDGRVRLANDAAARVLGRSARDLVGETADSLGIASLLEGAVPRVLSSLGSGEPAEGAQGRGPWELRRGTFRMSGEAQTLLVLSDVGMALRGNERDAWRRIIRVMGHEINNSLSPIKSIAESLLKARPDDPERESDLKGGLGIIARRSEALSRFMESYAMLARLPPPRRIPVRIVAAIEKIATLDARVPVEVLGGPDVTVNADPDQLEQALINLVKNAVEASLLTKEERREPASARIRWSSESGWVVVAIEDDGPGVDDATNLFVPFYTTKPSGSGIGLVLSRQIAEAHDGELSLSSRRDGHGAIARLRLPAR
jgi:nitrogen fixation/metabolism regulation signal transduction histidine kinase